MSVDRASPSNERLNISEAAAELGISERSTRRLIDRGELPAYKPTPRRVWIRRADLAAFLASRKTTNAKGD